MKNRVELCCHTKMSKLQGINYAKEYIEEAINRGYKSIAITDVDSTQSFLEAYRYLKSNANNTDFKIIYGSEMHFKNSQDSDKLYTIYIYVKEQRGLKNLYKLISKAYSNKRNKIPTIYKNDLIKYRSGLLYAAIGNQSEVYQNIENKNTNLIFNFYDFIGIEPNESSKNINIKINRLCKKYNKILVGTSECNFIDKDDYKCNEILNLYKKSTNIKLGNTKYFQSTDELLSSFSYIEDSKDIVINNPIKISEKIRNIDLAPDKVTYPKLETAIITISQKCYKKAEEIYGKKLPEEVKERLKLELHSIEEKNLEIIYLVSSELVDYSKKLEYKVGSRGNIGNSFVAFLLGITDINPIQHNLPFEFFAGKDYDREPDIDLNFSSKIQEKIFTYLQKRFGKNKIIWGGTVEDLKDKTIEKACNGYVDLFGIKDISCKYSIINKLVGVKSCTGENLGRVFIIPDGLEISNLFPIEIGNKGHFKTHCDYRELCDLGLYKLEILSSDVLTMIHELEKETKINSKVIDLNDKETLKMFLHANDNSYPVSINGIPEFGTTFAKKMIEIAKPRNFNDLVCILALFHGTETWNYNASFLIKNEHKRLSEVISNREDMFNYLINHGIEKSIAFDIVEFVRKGILFKNDRKINDKWEEYKIILKEHNIPKWYIESAEKIKYMFPKAHVIEYTMNVFKIAWFKVHYPKAFYDVYFKVESNLNIDEYYCKRQVKNELNRLYDLKEIHENNIDFDYDYNNEKKIQDLELILEMFNSGILKEKTEIKDDYNLINSKAISDYCRSIEHKFNTEELAVLVYRNKKMNIEEKIDKYKDLIKNYPDMEVIERINCKHYDSIKEMIENEISRLEDLYHKFISKNEDCIYTWIEYNKSTLQYDHRNTIKNTKKTFEEAYKEVSDYVKEYNDTISFEIIMKDFNNWENNITGYYVIENEEIKLINLIENKNNFLDIDNIFLNMPTPFKKGDILISNSKAKNYGDFGEIFVLYYLSTWRKNLDELLKKGNYDSSDMIGYVYYLYGEDSTEFVLDHKWDYDSFEYYDGELTGKNRILKDISSFIKGKIGLELFIHAYDFYKTEYKNEMTEFYTDEGLKLAGMTSKDIERINHKKKKNV